MRLHGGETRLAGGAKYPVERRDRDVEPLVHVPLPAVESQPLIEIASRVQQAEADHRDAQIGGGFAVIARQDAESA